MTTAQNTHAHLAAAAVAVVVVVVVAGDRIVIRGPIIIGRSEQPAEDRAGGNSAPVIAPPSSAPPASAKSAAMEAATSVPTTATVFSKGVACTKRNAERSNG